MGDHHGIKRHHSVARAVEQGQDRRPEGIVQGQGHLGGIWALRVRVQMENRVRELALFNLGIDSKLGGCDLVSLKVRDVCHGDTVASRAVVMQHKTQRPVQLEITPVTRDAVQQWIKQAGLRFEDFLFPSRMHRSPHLGTRQYARILEGWVEELGLDPADYGKHSMRGTKATLIHRRTKNLRAVQLLLGHSGLESTVRYLGIEVDDALEIGDLREPTAVVPSGSGRSQRQLPGSRTGGRFRPRPTVHGRLLAGIAAGCRGAGAQVRRCAA